MVFAKLSPSLGILDWHLEADFGQGQRGNFLGSAVGTMQQHNIPDNEEMMLLPEMMTE